jgi:hypothetical protein
VRIQIERLSPHQNAKVFAVLMAVASLLFVIPMFIAFSFIPAGVDSHGNPVSPPPAAFVLLFPLIYLVLGYVMVAAGCWFYNLMFKYLGGFEYESRDQ